MKRAVFVALILAAGALHAQSGKPAAQAPIFEVDPFWPKPLPNHWVTGSTIGLSVDAQDRVWTIHRPGTVEANFKAADLTVAEAVDDEVQPGAKSSAPAKDPIGVCCKVAPPVLVYDQAGNLVKSWGGPGTGYEWPDSNHGITVDKNGNVWLAGNGQKDTQVLKFSDAGKFLLQLGKHGVHNGSNDIANFWQPRRSFTSPRPTRSTSPMATAIAASSSSTRTPAPTSATGARTETNRTTRRCRRTTRRRRLRSSSAPCTA